MSHNITTIDAVEPVSNIITLPSASIVAFKWSKETVASVNIGSYSHGVGKNTPFYQNPTYVQMSLATGVSVARSAQFPLAATAANWFDEITLPAGNYILHHSFCGSQTNQQTGSIAWVNNSTGTRLSQVMSFRNPHRPASVEFAFSAPAEGLQIAARIITASVAIHSYHGFPSTSIVIIKL